MPYIKTTTYSVTVTLDALEKHLSNQLRDILLENLHVESLIQSHVQVDVVNDSITFYTMEVK